MSINELFIKTITNILEYLNVSEETYEDIKNKQYSTSEKTVLQGKDFNIELSILKVTRLYNDDGVKERFDYALYFSLTYLGRKQSSAISGFNNDPEYLNISDEELYENVKSMMYRFDEKMIRIFKINKIKKRLLTA